MSQLYFNSSEYCKNINFNIELRHVDKENPIESHENLVIDKIIIWRNESYDVLDVYVKNSAAALPIKELSEKYIYEYGKKGNGYQYYLSIYLNSIIKRNNKEDLNNDFYILCDVNYSPVILEPSLTETDSFLFSFRLSPRFEIYFDENYDNNMANEDVSDFRNRLKTPQKLNSNEMAAIKKLINAQNDEKYFTQLTKKEIKQKRRKKNIKETSETTIKEMSDFVVKNVFPVKKEQESSSKANDNINEIQSLKILNGSSDPIGELDDIVGLDDIKRSIEKMKYKLEYQEERKQRGIGTVETNNMHMVFTGNPGTGKTTIARIMAGILYEMGYIKDNKCIEINGLEMKSAYIGQTAILTKKIIDIAKGGVLFIDEAYALCNSSTKDTGKEAISVLLKEMEDNRGDLVVIFAGYQGDMDNFLAVNPGFRSRVNRYFEFPDYTVEELCMIYVNFLKKKHLKITEDALIKSAEVFKNARNSYNFSNARFVRNFSEKIEESHILDVVENKKYDLIDIVTTI